MDMDTITLTVDYNGEITLGGTFKTMGPITMHWFHGNDLLIETLDDRIIFNTDTFQDVGGQYTVRPRTLSKQLRVVAEQDVTVFDKKFTLELAQSDTDKYLTVTDGSGKRYAYKLD